MEFAFIAKLLSVINGALSLLKELWRLFSFGRAKFSSEQAISYVDSTDSVACRFFKLFESHGVHRNQIPEFFGHDLKLADVQSEERLIEKLSPEILSDAAELFFINSEWLAHGYGDIYPKHHFYKHPDMFGQLIDKQVSKYEKHHFGCAVFRSDKNSTSSSDALLILKVPIGEIGHRFIYAYHMCPGWVIHCGASAADLACCISQATQRKVYPHGCIVPDQWLSEIADCQKLLKYDFASESIDYPYVDQWNPSEFSDTAIAFIDPLKFSQDRYNITSALALWWAYYQKGLIYVYSDEVNLKTGQEFMDMAKSYGLELSPD